MELAAAVRLLTSLALRSREALLSSGAVEVLVLHCQLDRLESVHALEALNWLTSAACTFRAEAAAAVAASGGIPAAVQCLCSNYRVPQLAAGLLGGIAEACPQLAADICAAGAVPQLEHMLCHSLNTKERGCVATALANIRRAAEALAGEEALTKKSRYSFFFKYLSP